MDIHIISVVQSGRQDSDLRVSELRAGKLRFRNRFGAIISYGSGGLGERGPVWPEGKVSGLFVRGV